VSERVRTSGRAFCVKCFWFWCWNPTQLPKEVFLIMECGFSTNCLMLGRIHLDDCVQASTPPRGVLRQAHFLLKPVLYVFFPSTQQTEMVLPCFFPDTVRTVISSGNLLRCQRISWNFCGANKRSELTTMSEAQLKFWRNLLEVGASWTYYGSYCSSLSKLNFPTFVMPTTNHSEKWAKNFHIARWLYQQPLHTTRIAFWIV